MENTATRLTVDDFDTARYFGYDGHMEGGYGHYLPVRPHGLWRERAATLMRAYGVKGKVLELGCAMGGWVREFRALGVNAFGLDLPWPIDHAVAELWPELAPYLIRADARDYLRAPERRGNEWRFIVSWNFLECLTPEDLALVVPRLNRVARGQVHIVDPRADGRYYTKLSLEEWRALGIKGVVIDGC